VFASNEATLGREFWTDGYYADTVGSRAARTKSFMKTTTWFYSESPIPRLRRGSLEEFQPKKYMSNGPSPGSAGNVIAALCSFFIPGLGQLTQGRILAALLYFFLAGILWFFFLGWLVHLLSALDAALYRG